MRKIGVAVIVLGLALSAARRGHEGLAGNWKLSLLEDGQPVPIWLMKLENKEGKLSGTMEGLRRFPPAQLADVKIQGDRLYFTIKIKTKAGLQSIAFEGVLPKAGGKKILGAMPWGEDENLFPVVLEQTAAKNTFEVDKELVTRFPSDPRVFAAVQELLRRAGDEKAPAKDVEEWVDTALRAAEKY